MDVTRPTHATWHRPHLDFYWDEVVALPISQKNSLFSGVRLAVFLKPRLNKGSNIRDWRIRLSRYFYGFTLFIVLSYFYDTVNCQDWESNNDTSYGSFHI